MKKNLPIILTFVFLASVVLISIWLDSCNIPNRRLIAKQNCIIDSFYEKKPIAINEFQTTYVYHTSCGDKIYTYNPNLYHINDTIIY